MPVWCIDSRIDSSRQLFRTAIEPWRRSLQIICSALPPPTRHTHKYILKGSQKHMGNVVQQKLATGPLSFSGWRLVHLFFRQRWDLLDCPDCPVSCKSFAFSGRGMAWMLDTSHVTPWNHLQKRAFFGFDMICYQFGSIRMAKNQPTTIQFFTTPWISHSQTLNSFISLFI